jgi:hydroxymethylpyrimidine/phosphomethylpyrimidine kinase
MKGRVLIVAGSDSGGGAGIQADIKAVTMLGGYAATAIAALTVQNTLGVTGVHPVPPPFVQAQMRAVLDDIGADAVKTGMLGDASMVEAVAAVMDAYPPIPLVVDPVMVAKGGARLLDEAAVGAFKAKLLPRATLVTPNTPELEALTGRTVGSEAEAVDAGRTLVAAGALAVLVKGGHLPGDEVVDWLLTAETEQRFSSLRIATRHTHGTGCTLASAIACELAKGLPLVEAVAAGRDYVQSAIRAAPGFGQGHGPLGHNFALTS